MGDVTVGIIETVEDLARLAGEWHDLCERASAMTPFQRPEWLLPWCRFFAPPRVEVLWARADGELVALFPFFRYDAEEGHVLALLGAGISDYLDAIVDPAFEDVAAEVLARHLDRANDIMRCDFDQLVGASALARWTPPAGWRAEEMPQDPCPVLRLTSGQGDIPGHQLARFRKYRRRAERQLGLRFECTTGTGWEGALRVFVRLHNARWRAQGSPGVLAGEKLEAFHHQVASGFAERGRLRLFTLFLAGRPAAALYGFVERDRLYCYLQGFDPEVDHASPGMLVVGHVLEHARDQGLAAVDFLRGQEPYKYAWGAVDVATVRRRLTRLTT